MNKLQKSTAVLLGMTFCTGLLLAQDSASFSLPEELDRNITVIRSAFGVPSVAVAVIKDGEIVYVKAFGESDLKQQSPAGNATRYAVGSISKQFTAAALLLEQEKGKLSLEDKVGKYLPDLTRAKRGHLTKRHVV